MISWTVAIAIATLIIVLPGLTASTLIKAKRDEAQVHITIAI